MPLTTSSLLAVLPARQAEPRCPSLLVRPTARIAALSRRDARWVGQGRPAAVVSLACLASSGLDLDLLGAGLSALAGHTRLPRLLRRDRTTLEVESLGSAVLPADHSVTASAPRQTNLLRTCRQQTTGRPRRRPAQRDRGSTGMRRPTSRAVAATRVAAQAAKVR